MSERHSGDGVPAFVSTGHLPPAGAVGQLLAEAYDEVRDVDEGEVSQVYPALARVPRGLFGIALPQWTQGSSPRATPTCRSRS